MRPLLLASQSPYRQELLTRLGIPFTCRAPRVDESALAEALHGQAPEAMALALARAKAGSLVDESPEAVVIGSDQVIALEDQIMGKPGSEARAIEQLERLSGRTHQLVTAVAIAHDGRLETFVSVARLTMRALGRPELARYVRADKPYDCAGSYKLEQLGIALFEKVEADDFTTITGLPLIELTSALRRLGYQIP